MSNDYLISFLITLAIVTLIYLKLVSKPKQTKPADTKPARLPYEEVDGVVTLDTDELLDSKLYKRITGEFKPEDYPGMVNLMKQCILPYNTSQYYKVLKGIRYSDNINKETTLKGYQQTITASAILFNRPIPKSLFTDEMVVLAYVHFYIQYCTPVSYDDQLQSYIKNQYNLDMENDPASYHTELNNLIKDLDSFNTFIHSTLEYEFMISIDHMYTSWLDTCRSSSNVFLYKSNIEYFKKLVTIYYGVMGLDTPVNYLHFTPAIADYVLQLNRYHPSNHLQLVVNNTDNAV